MRVGDWRVIFKVRDDSREVLIGGVRRRNERTYDRIEDLFD